MGNIATDLGSLICHFVTNLFGSGQAVCYNPSSASTIGYSIILGLVLIVGFRRLFSQAG